MEDIIKEKTEMGQSLLSLRKFDDAVKFYEDLVKEFPVYADLRNKLGIAYFFVGKIEQAQDEFLEALKINPDFVEARLNLSITLNELQKHDNAFSEMILARDSEKYLFGLNSGERIKITSMHEQIGDLYKLFGLNKDARREYNKALKYNPAFNDIRNKLASVLMDLGVFKSAMKHLRIILKSSPGYLDARVNLGKSYYHLGKIKQSEKEWDRVLKNDPDNVRAKTYLKILKTDQMQKKRQDIYE
jgi:tetratricopeptide (TPR) repeat protein